MVDTNTALMIGGAVLGLAALYLLFTDILSFLFLVLIAGIVVFLLMKSGFLSVSDKPGELDITLQEDAPTPATTTTKSQPKTTSDGLPEVFNVSDNVFTYAEAPAVCSAYGAEMATYSQVEEAYMNGAEWCNYGWTKGGMALFPTQQHTWQSLQSEPELSKRTACGRPGINGGTFDSKTKFGVNCYGVKPKQPKGVKGNTQADKAFKSLVARIKSQLGRLTVFGWDQKDWSEHAAEKKAVGEGEGLIHDIESDFSKVGADVKKAL